MKDMRIEDRAKEFPLHKPTCFNGRSDLYVIFTDRGDVDIAVYDERKNLWYSMTDPTGFGNVTHYAPFDMPEKFKYSKELDELVYGEGDYEI